MLILIASCSTVKHITQSNSNISRQQKMLMRKWYNRFHASKNGIHISNFQKNYIFPSTQLKGAVNRLPTFKVLSDHTNRPLMG